MMKQIPADLVIDCMMAAMANHSNVAALHQNHTYHVGSSSRNPFRLGSLPNISYLYFKNNPLTTKNGKLVMIRSKGALASNVRFHMFLFIRALLPLKVVYLSHKELGSAKQFLCVRIHVCG